MSLFRRRRPALAVAVGAIAAVALSGCAAVTPYAVAHHDDKMTYHETAVEGLLTSTVFEQLAETESYAAVGYTHAQADSGESLHQQHETSVLGATYWSQESTDADGMTIDRIHLGGSANTYYLFGDAYLSVSKTPWVTMPEGDIRADAESVCFYPSVWYLCGIALAWQNTRDTHGDATPVKVDVKSDGSMQLTTAVTLRAIVDASLFSLSSDLEQSISDETFNTFLPLTVFFGPDGQVTKAEINGAFGESPRLELQLGFELTGEANEENRPPDPATIDPQYVTAVTSQSEVNAFWDAIAQIRLGG